MENYANRSQFWRVVLALVFLAARVGVIGSLYLATVLVAATTAGLTGTDGRSSSAFLSSIAPIFSIKPHLLPPQAFVLAYLVLGAAPCVCRLLGSANKVCCSIHRGSRGESTAARRILEQHKRDVARAADGGSASESGYVASEAVPGRAGLASVLGQVHTGSAEVAAAGAFIFSLVGGLHLIACSPYAGAYARSSGSSAVPFAGAPLLGAAPGECLTDWSAWIILVLTMVAFMCNFSVSVAQRLRCHVSLTRMPSVPGATAIAMHAVQYDVWDCASAILCIVVLPSVPVVVTVLSLTLGQALVLCHVASRSSSTHLWQWGVSVLWHALRLGWCVCAMLVALSSGSITRTLSGVLLLVACSSILSCAVAAAAVV